MSGQYNGAGFPVPQGQRFPGVSGSQMRGYYTGANFPVPQGQSWPGKSCAKVVQMPPVGPPNTKMVTMSGQYSSAVYQKAPFFAGMRGMGRCGMGDVTTTPSFLTPVTDFISANPGTSLGIAGAAIALAMFSGKRR